MSVHFLTDSRAGCAGRRARERPQARLVVEHINRRAVVVHAGAVDHGRA